MLLWVRQLQVAVSQVFGICCCEVLDDECCVCYYSLAMRDVWHLQITSDKHRDELVMKLKLSAENSSKLRSQGDCEVNKQNTYCFDYWCYGSTLLMRPTTAA